MCTSKFNSEMYPDPTPYEALKKVAKAGQKFGFRPLVYICSPYSGDVQENVAKARAYCRFTVEKGCIPIAPHHEDPEAYQRAFDTAQQVLAEGKLLGIFPEGGITRDGQLQPFKGGVVKILRRASKEGLHVPTVPMALTNLWGSFFSRIERGGAMARPFRRGMFNRVGLNVGAPLPMTEVTPAVLQARVAQLLEQPQPPASH